VRGVFDPSRLCAQDDRSPSRHAERGASHGRQIGHLRDNPARDVDLPALKTVRPKWALTIAQAGQLLQALPPLARTMAGLAMLSGLQRGELFALRWRDVNEPSRCLTVREAT
jgi:integrase